MKYLIPLTVIFLISLLAGCAAGLVNVDFDTCTQRGTLDGVKVAQCRKAGNVK